MKRRVGVLVSVLATAAASVLVSSSPAAAHDTSATVWTGAPPVLVGRAQGGVKANHTRVWVCDRVAEGWGARTNYWTDRSGNAYSQRMIVGDANGSASGCGEEPTDDGGRVTEFQVCVGANGANSYCTGRIGA